MKTFEEDPPLANECKLPWMIDAFLYPISASGLVHLVIFVVVPLLISTLIRFIEHLLAPHLGSATAEITEPVKVILLVIFYSYVCYYIADCVISSSRGCRRATDVTISNTISIGDFISQAFIIMGCIAICLSPMLLYSVFVKRHDVWFWILSAYGFFFLPMSLLRGIMFDAFDALNPIELVRSICHTILPYFGLVLFFLVLGVIVVGLIPKLPVWNFLKRVPQIYLIFVLTRRLGWFYWWYKDKLGWDI